tara:strand:+ start:420 stop:539 length:120 start_codon:yes stop_codon:yes gene_type:complete
MSHQSDKMKASITGYGFLEPEEKKKKTNKKSSNATNSSN